VFNVSFTVSVALSAVFCLCVVWYFVWFVYFCVLCVLLLMKHHLHLSYIIIIIIMCRGQYTLWKLPFVQFPPSSSNFLRPRCRQSPLKPVSPVSNEYRTAGSVPFNIHRFLWRNEKEDVWFASVDTSAMLKSNGPCLQLIQSPYCLYEQEMCPWLWNKLRAPALYLVPDIGVFANASLKCNVANLGDSRMRYIVNVHGFQDRKKWSRGKGRDYSVIFKWTVL
jgi:hypothetical protein